MRLEFDTALKIKKIIIKLENLVFWALRLKEANLERQAHPRRRKTHQIENNELLNSLWEKKNSPK